MHKELGEQLAAVFKEPIEPVAVSVFYKTALLLVAAVMLLLPVVYLAMVAAVGYGVYYYATHFYGMLEHMPFIAGLALYAGPLLGGSIMLIYMVKPLLPRWGRRRKALYEVTEDNEPQFYRFVEQVCDAVGAPFPRRIELSMDANAFASFRRGFWSFFSGDDLVLCVGLPLLSSLTVQQLAGVLAHEMGHFSQGTGMRLSYIIHRVNYWFVEAVYGGQTLTQKLADTREGMRGTAALMLAVAELFIFLTRGILYLFMMFGYLISNLLSRQMEFDADTYQIRLTGSTSFESTMYSIQLLGAAFQNVTMMSMMTQNRFVLSEDLPFLVRHHGKAILTTHKEDIINSVLVPDTRVFDTHPSPRDRIARAKQQPVKGICKIKAPASLLFDNFSALSKQMTTIFYEETLGPKTRSFKLLPAEQFVEHFNENRDRYMI